MAKTWALIVERRKIENARQKTFGRQARTKILLTFARWAAAPAPTYMAMNKYSFQYFLPYFICIALFYALTIAFFRPEVLDGKSLAQSDILHYLGGAQETREYNRTHDEPTLWSNSMFGGMPVYLLQTSYPDGPVALIDRVFKGLFFGGKSAHIPFLTMLCSFVALLCFGVRPYVAAIGGVAYAFGTYNLILIEVGHLTKAWALAYAPLVLAGMHLAFRGRLLGGFALTALALALEIRANHLQITYYLAFVCGIYGLSEFIFAFRDKKLPAFAKAAGVLLLGVLLGVGVNAGRLLVTQEYSQYTQRGKAELKPIPGQESASADDGLTKDYAFNWSQGVGESLTLLLPNLYGGSNKEKISQKGELYGILGQEEVQFMYWGDQPFTSAPVYAGATVCFLFVLGLLVAPPRQRWWLVAGAAMMLLLSWGKNFSALNYFLFDTLPGFNKFRAVSMAISLTVMLMTLGGALGLEKLLEAKYDKELLRKLIIAFAATGGLCLLLWLFAGMLSFAGASDPEMQAGLAQQIAQQRVGQEQAMQQAQTIMDAVRMERKAMLRADALRSLAFVALVAAALYFYFQQKISAMVAVTLVGGLTLVDVWGVGKRYLNEATFQENVKETHFSPSKTDNFILQDKDPSYRVLNLAASTFQDAATSYFHKSVGGYFSAKVRRYQDLIDRKLQGEIGNLVAPLQRGSMPDFAQTPVLNMFNTRYIILDPNGGDKGALKNPNALGNAWFVAGLQVVDGPDAEMAALGSVPPDSLAIIDGSKFKPSATRYAREGASIRLTEYQPNKLVYEANAPAPGFVVFSEVYYADGWKAKFDGQPAPHVRVNYALRGMEVPAGKHTIEFVFDPDTYRTGSLITQVSSYLVVLALAGALALLFVRKR
jgi:hypothetical protein